MRDLKTEIKILIFGKIPAFLLLVGGLIFLWESYQNFLIARKELKNFKESSSQAQLAGHLFLEKGMALRFLKGKASAQEYKTIGRVGDRFVDLLKLEALNNSNKDFEKTLFSLKALREEIFTQNYPVEEAIKAYDNLSMELLRRPYFSSDLKNFTNLAYEIDNLHFDMGRFRDLLMVESFRNMPVVASQLESLLALHAIIRNQLEGIELRHGSDFISGVQSIKKSDEWAGISKSFLTIVKSADQGNFKIDPNEIFFKFEFMEQILNKTSQSAWENAGRQAVKIETSKRVEFILTTIGFFAIAGLLGFLMRSFYRMAIFDHKRLIWQSRRKMAGSRPILVEQDRPAFSDQFKVLCDFPTRYRIALSNFDQNGKKQHKLTQDLENINRDFLHELQELFQVMVGEKVSVLDFMAFKKYDADESELRNRRKNGGYIDNSTHSGSEKFLSAAEGKKVV